MMARGPAASEGGGQALGRGREEDRGKGFGHRGQVVGSQHLEAAPRLLSGHVWERRQDLG